MTASTLQKEIGKAVPILLSISREQTYNNISDNCKFILTEIKNSEENVYVRAQLRKKENDKKNPVTLSELMPALQNIFEDIYDLNLHIYRSTKNLTVVDFRYYPKSSLDPDYRLKVLRNPPMLHYRIPQPPWMAGKKEKFDINWEHYEGLNKFRLLWLRLKLRLSA